MKLLIVKSSHHSHKPSFARTLFFGAKNMAYVPPVGQTTDPDIFLENVKRADRLISGPAETVPDRGGEPLDTWRQMMAKNDAAIEDARKNITILGLPFATREEAQAAADEGKIPVGGITWARNLNDESLADELINNGGTLEATGRAMPSQYAIDRYLQPMPDGSLIISGENGAALVIDKTAATHLVELIIQNQIRIGGLRLAQGENGVPLMLTGENGIPLALGRDG
ncbi:hypothetical protein AB3X35_19950, partial [Raoultella terrigena]